VRKEERAYRRMGKRTRTSLNVLYANSFFEGFSWSMGSVVFVLFMDQIFHLGEWRFSLLFGVSQALGLVMVIMSGVLGDRYSKKALIVHGSIWGRVSTIIMSFSPLLPFGRIIAFITYAGKDVGRQIAQPASRSLQADIVPTRLRGRLIATIQAVSNIGATVGPVLGGFLWDLTHHRSFSILSFELPGYSIPFLISAASGIIAALLVQRYVYEKKARRREFPAR